MEVHDTEVEHARNSPPVTTHSKSNQERRIIARMTRALARASEKNADTMAPV